MITTIFFLFIINEKKKSSIKSMLTATPQDMCFWIPGLSWYSRMRAYSHISFVSVLLLFFFSRFSSLRSLFPFLKKKKVCFFFLSGVFLLLFHLFLLLFSAFLLRSFVVLPRLSLSLPFFFVVLWKEAPWKMHTARIKTSDKLRTQNSALSVSFFVY